MAAAAGKDVIAVEESVIRECNSAPSGSNKGTSASPWRFRNTQVPIRDQLAVGRRGGVVELVDDEVVEGVRREALQMLAPAKDPDRNSVATLAADASRRAALLVAYIRPVCALLAPYRAGASTRKVPTLFRPGSYAFGSRRIRLRHPDP
jgi:hypothetical protein